VAHGSPDVSLLMPNRNNGGILDLALEKLAEHTTYPSFELIVVDDGSTDGSRRILRRWRDSGRFRSFTLIEAEQRGVQASLNAAAAAASGDLLVQMDGDATLETPGWLERMVEFQQSDPRVAVVTPAVVFDSGRVHAYGVNIVGPDGLHDGGTEIAEPAGRRTLHQNVRRPRARRLPPPAHPAEVDASIGCCMLFPRALHDELGGYDTGFAPVWFEDLDLSLAARRLGGKVFLLGDVEVVHRISLRDEDPGALRRLARRLPQVAKDAVVAAGRLGRLRPDQVALLRHHYAYWREKWGFDLLNPDMDDVLARYGDTEVCWRYPAGAPISA
jgi:GT2 family glycosyltransferase